MRLDLVVNLLTMQALTKGAITVLGGDQTRPNIHIDDLVDLYLFAFDRRLAGLYNAGFENLKVREIADADCRRRAGGDQGAAVERSALVFGLLRPAARDRFQPQAETSRRRFATSWPPIVTDGSRTSRRPTTSTG